MIPPMHVDEGPAPRAVIALRIVGHARVTPSDEPPPDVAPQLAAVFDRLDARLRQRGMTVAAALGYDVVAWHVDAAQAAASALELGDGSGGDPLYDVAVGVALSETRVVRGRLLGDALEIAWALARVAAPRQVLVTPSVLGALPGGAWHYEALEPLRIRSFAHPVERGVLRTAG